MQNNPFIFSQEPAGTNTARSPGDASEWKLAAVYAVNAENTAVTLLLDGTDEPTQKYYKVLTGAWPLAPDDRVIVLKMSGTYVVVGKIGGQPVTPTPTFTAQPNTVFAGPASGDTAGEASFRALVKEDLPGGGGGDMETIIVTTGIMTAASGVTIASQRLAYCGKFAVLHFSYKPGTNLQQDYNSKVLATLAEDYWPAVAKSILAESFNAAGSTGGRTEALVQITEAGVITHCGKATYNGTYECSIEYLLP